MHPLINEDYKKLIKSIPDINAPNPTDSNLVTHCCRILSNPAAEHMLFISTPYIHEKAHVRYARRALAGNISKVLNDNNINAYNPIEDQSKSQKHTNWYDINLNIMNKATHLIVLNVPGIDISLGVAMEIGFAKNKQIPIYKISETLWQHLVRPVERMNLHDGY